MSDEIRPGEVALTKDPASKMDAGVTFIGRITSPWSPSVYVKNLTQARAQGGGGRVTLDPEYRPGLQGLTQGQSVILLYWMHKARRDIVLQAPNHSTGPRGVFSIRSPVRPNSIAMATVQITELHEDGFHIDAIDCFDGTPLLDIKPWLPGIDQPS